MATKIGTFLENRREELEMSREDVALQMPITASTIGQIERGETKIPSIPVLEAFASALRVSMSTLEDLLPSEAMPREDVAVNKDFSFDLLEIGQIEIMHDQVHSRLGNEDDTECGALRKQHDSLAAELVKRGVMHDTEVICPESELAQKAPNYRRAFTDEECAQCAFGQLSPFCNLYKADYTKGDTCDSFRYFEVLELEPPHGFLMANGKQTAIATATHNKVDKAYLIISAGEVFGIAELEEAVSMKTKEFDDEEWLEQHRITPRERRQWWPDSNAFYVHRVREWYPYEGIKLYENGKVVDEPKLTPKQWQQVSKSRELPKTIPLVTEAVMLADDNTFSIDPQVGHSQNLLDILSATYDQDISFGSTSDNNKEYLIPIYSLALVRNPRMRVSKKNLIIEGEKRKKQEDDVMPFAVRLIDGEYCVINTDTDESRGCHETEEEAEAQLAALRINVEEGESGTYTDKPRKRKPRKKALESGDIIKIPENKKKPTFMENLKFLGKSIQDFLKSAENDEKGVSLFVDEAGIAQKTVNGELWHFTYSTNAFEDREGEIFSTKSLEDYVASNQPNEDKGYFNLWHINIQDGNFNTDFAKKKWQGVVGRFLIEAGPYLDDEKGKVAKEFFKQFGDKHPDIAPEGWGCSPEFRYLPEERETGIYKTIWITRTSTLPKFAAANVWTETRQLKAGNKMALSEQQIKAAIEVFGNDLVSAMIKEAESKTTELEAAGVAHKSESKPQEIQLNIEELAAEVGKQFAADLTPVAEAMVTMADSLKIIEERLEKVEENKNIKEKTEMPRFIFNMKRASEDKETIVTEDDGLKNQKPKEAKSDSNDPWLQIFGSK